MRLQLNIYQMRCLECQEIFYEATESLPWCPYCKSGLMIQELEKIKVVELDIKSGEIKVIEIKNDNTPLIY